MNIPANRDSGKPGAMRIGVYGAQAKGEPVDVNILSAIFSMFMGTVYILGCRGLTFRRWVP